MIRGESKTTYDLQDTLIMTMVMMLIMSAMMMVMVMIIIVKQLADVD